MTFPKPQDFMVSVLVYETRNCSFCKRAKTLLERRGIDYSSYGIDGDYPAREWVEEQSGQTSFPQIFVRGYPVGGYQELATLDRRGELDDLLMRTPAWVGEDGAPSADELDASASPDPSPASPSMPEPGSPRKATEPEAAAPRKESGRSKPGLRGMWSRLTGRN